MISVSHLKKTYRVGKIEVDAVKDVSFDVGKGEFVNIHGPSGSGKSTILHLLGLLDDPTKGTITLNGKNVSSLPESEKSKIRLMKMGFVFQEYNILPELTALENTVLPALMTDASHDLIYRKAEKILRYLGLGHRLHHLPSELSGGEKQRVSIARSLINDPEIIFADEPTANLDSVTSEITINLFKKMNEELQLTILLVSHNPKYLVYANKIVFVEDGLVKNIQINRKTDKSDRFSLLRSFIRNSLKKGYSINAITSILVKAGWKKSIIEAELSTGVSKTPVG
ncbi:MAG: ABC transporter ATP-binding protein [Nanoarchaeota archaeon]